MAGGILGALTTLSQGESGLQQEPRNHTRFVSESGVSTNWPWDVLGCEMGTVSPISLGALQDETKDPGESPGASGVGSKGEVRSGNACKPCSGGGFP